RRLRTAPRRTLQPARSRRGAPAPAYSRRVLVGTRLERLAEDPGAAGLFFDIDGTLAPIVARPDLAVVPAVTRAELERLARSYSLVACVSGRTAADAERVVDVEGIRYVGEHGRELDPAAARWAQKLAAFAARVDWPAEEGKRLTLAFHFRGAGDEAEAVRTLR